MERRLGRLLTDLHFAEPAPKMAFVVGPRQCGKTFMARMLQEERGSADLYRDWDDQQFRKDLAKAPYGFLDAFRPASSRRPLAVLDEIHKFPRWKNYLKGLWDTRRERADFLVTGSGRLDIYQRGGDSLLGRYHQYRLHPLSVSEILGNAFDPERDDPEALVSRILKEPSRPSARAAEAFAGLMRFGGFPEPFLGQSERRHRLWLRERRDRILSEDLRDLTRLQMLSSVEHLAALLPQRVGSLLSLNSIREDLGVSLESVRLWMSQLERLYFCHRLTPFAGTLSRSLRREPKLYLWDWSGLEDEGARFENLMAGALNRWCHFAQDWGQKALSVHFVRDKEKREVDFLLALEGRPLLLVEAKLSQTRPTRHLHYFAERLGDVPKLLVVANAAQAGAAAGVPVLPAPEFLAAIP
ncbi:MAG: ATP-binding protein [Elusimicrobia bacterium]|nr:ATP-binding protein [Elusimicrobiota bacterium]